MHALAPAISRHAPAKRTSSAGAAVAGLAAAWLGALIAAAPAPAQSLEPATVAIPAGSFVRGSDRAERDAAYALDEAAYGHDVTRRQGWYENEPERGEASISAFRITVTPITNRQYQPFIAATGRAAPDVDRETWRGYKLVHPFERTRRFAWRNGAPPAGREDHPVVLISYGDATAFAAWLSAQTGETWRLPMELEWEKAARGVDGRRFPWGDEFDPSLLDSHDAGPFDTVPVGSYADGRSPFGLLDAAGQVYEWTATSAGADRQIVKGGSWDDKGCGVCRPAARHGRPRALKHIILGFRLVREP
jgi:formylglycine-generating enzyme required for sulfatase activity